LFEPPVLPDLLSYLLDFVLQHYLPKRLEKQKLNSDQLLSDFVNAKYVTLFFSCLDINQEVNPDCLFLILLNVSGVIPSIEAI